MHDTRKIVDDCYREIGLLEQRIDDYRARIRHEQSNCFHDHRRTFVSPGEQWCEECDKYLGKV